MISRDVREYFMPSVPMEIPSETVMVLKMMGLPPAEDTPASKPVKKKKEKLDPRVYQARIVDRFSKDGSSYRVGVPSSAGLA